MVQIPVWPLPYWATACLLRLAYLPMGWLAWKAAKRTEEHDATGMACVFASIFLLFVLIAYAFCPGFYFQLALKDIRWAYLEAK